MKIYYQDINKIYCVFVFAYCVSFVDLVVIMNDFVEEMSARERIKSKMCEIG
jgi:hypothetical protein